MTGPDSRSRNVVCFILMLPLAMANARNNFLEIKIPSPTMNFKQRTGLVVTTSTTRSTAPDNKPCTYTDRTILADSLARADWSPVFGCVNVNQCSNEIGQIVQNSIKTAQKNLPPNTRLRKLKPWITTELIKMIRERDKLSKKVKKQPFNDDLKIRYRNLRNRTGLLISQVKHNIYRAKLDQS